MVIGRFLTSYGRVKEIPETTMDFCLKQTGVKRCSLLLERDEFPPGYTICDPLRPNNINVAFANQQLDVVSCKATMSP
jgi:hypothetical protein